VSDISKDDIKTAIHDAISECTFIDFETHTAHHQFVNEMIERRQRRQQLYDKVRQHVIGWGALSVITGLGALIYQAIISFVQRNGGHG